MRPLISLGRGQRLMGKGPQTMHAIRMLGAMLPLAGAACAAGLPQTDRTLW